MRVTLLLILYLNFICVHITVAQDSSSIAEKALDFPLNFASHVKKKTDQLKTSLGQKTEKYLKKLARQEAQLKRKLQAIDSSASKDLFPADPAQQYTAWIKKIVSDTGKVDIPLSGAYMPYIDSLKNSLAFLYNNPQITAFSRSFSEDVQKSIASLQELQAKMQSAGQIKQFIRQRREEIRQYLSRYAKLPKGITRTFKEYNKQLYYYSEQVKTYKETLNDPDKMLNTALKLLNKMPAFTTFMKKNSMLARLFQLPATGTDYGMAQVSQTGLPTRDEVVAIMQDQAGLNSVNVTALVRQNLVDARSQIDGLRNKLNNLGGGSDELEMPDFKPNAQKTKSFWKRLEYGTNLQSQKSNFYPVTTDLGLSVGYKINDNNVLGIGASYKVGLGSGFRHIAFSSEGVGLRSFLDMKVKNSFYATGGFEYNYQQAFSSLQQIHDLQQWQQSGLIGVTKILSLKSKFLKKSRLQLLWDFLSYRQMPQAQALKFRVGYNF
jgi:hypothetical protein